MSIAANMNWLNIEWSDAKSVVDHTLSSTEPLGWDNRNDYILIRRFLLNPNWLLRWVPQEANSCADMAAKSALKLIGDFVYDESNFNTIPSVILFQLLAEESGFRL